MWSTWTAAVVFIAVGCVIGLARYNEEWARTTGVVLALVGVLFMGAAAVTSVWVIAYQRARQVCKAIEDQGNRIVNVVTAVERADDELRRR